MPSPKQSASEVYKSVLEMISRAGVPDDTRWCSLILYFRELKDYSHLSDLQKERIQSILTHLLEQGDYSEQQLHKVLTEYLNILADPYTQKIESLLREAAAVFGNFRKLLAARHGNIDDLETFTLRSIMEAESEDVLMNALRDAFNNVKTLLESDIRSLEDLASRDELTHLANRRAFDAFIEPAIQRWEKDRRPLALAVFDIDHFKLFNDRHGHRIGDQVLQLVAKHLTHQLELLGKSGRQALAARYGGEEFILAISGPGAESLPDIVADILLTMRNFNFIIRNANGDVVETGLRITLSAGVAACTMDWKGAFLANLMDSADRAMYEAKNQGRDRAFVFDPESSSSFRPLPLKTASPPPDPCSLPKARKKP